MMETQSQLNRRRAPAARPASMTAAVIAGPEQVELVERPLPTPGRGQVRIRIEGCGVCASNVPVWQGRPWFDYPAEPGAPGHEAWGVIDAVGSDVQGLCESQRVACLSYHGFAEYDVADANAVVPLPESLGDVPLPGEPLGCAWNIFRRSDIRSGQPVAIVGIGFLGALLVQLASRAGAAVIAVSRRSGSLEFARRCGAAHTLALDDGDLAQRLNEITGAGACPRVIEATGKQSGLDAASGLVGERGKLIVAGFHQDGDRRVDMQSWNWRGIDVINAHERDPGVYIDGMSAAIDEVAAGRLDVKPLLTHSYPLGALGDALRAADQRPDHFLKAYVSLGVGDTG